jgi:hypothetical protein
VIPVNESHIAKPEILTEQTSCNLVHVLVRWCPFIRNGDKIFRICDRSGLGGPFGANEDVAEDSDFGLFSVVRQSWEASPWPVAIRTMPCNGQSHDHTFQVLS